MPRLRPIPSHLQDVFGSARFRSAQRRYNGLFAFTALGAGGIGKRSWTQPLAPSMLSLHGRAYHTIFDLQEQYNDMNVINNARFYIYNSEFNIRNQHHNALTFKSQTLCANMSTPIFRGQNQYRSAVGITNEALAANGITPCIDIEVNLPVRLSVSVVSLIASLFGL